MAASFDVTKPHERSNYYSDKELLDILRDATRELGELPSINQFREIDGTPAFNTYQRRFGSWDQAIKQSLETTEGAQNNNSPAMNVPLGRELKRSRRDSGVTQAELAEVVGVSQSTVWGWEAAAHEPSRDERMELRAALIKLGIVVDD